MEKVLVVSTADLRAIGRFEGAVGFTGDELPDKILGLPSKFIDRDDAENDPSYKQIIPYCVVIRGGLPLFYRRTKSGGESRLHGKVSCGFGGHINPVDGASDTEAQVRGAVHRELSEELCIAGTKWSPDLVGVVNDESTPVGAVHLVLVFRLYLHPYGGVHATEKEIELLGFMSPKDAQHFTPWENWTRLCVDRQLHENFIGDFK